MHPLRIDIGCHYMVGREGDYGVDWSRWLTEHFDKTIGLRKYTRGDAM